MTIPKVGSIIFVDYRCWWNDFSEAKRKFPDIKELVVKGTVVAVDFIRNKATICFPAILETIQKGFAFFSHSFVKNSVQSHKRELVLAEFLQKQGKPNSAISYFRTNTTFMSHF
jgi:hypothetical protein